MRASRLALCTLALAGVAGLASTAHAQQSGTTKPATKPAARPAMPGGHMGMPMMKDGMIANLERHRKNVLDYVAAAPDSMMGFRSTPGVRTFAQQIHHIAQAQAGILANLFGAAPMAGLMDTSKVFTDRAALRDYVNASYDYVAKLVREATPAQMMAEKQMFGMTRTGMQWVMGVEEHATWTLGQTVPYLRMNGVTPPPYLPF